MAAPEGSAASEQAWVDTECGCDRSPDVPVGSPCPIHKPTAASSSERTAYVAEGENPGNRLCLRSDDSTAATELGPTYPSVTRLTIKNLVVPYQRGDGLAGRVAELEDQVSGLLELLVESGAIPADTVTKEPRDV